ncbi:hypothetical protein Fmac_027766 [Flemingia macrophylla]|uniref:Uncharacterized protein n=1 Tax=Flemingia macrophylla TaxID=520843 RepID=A0ABD1LIT2_9FABA
MPPEVFEISSDEEEVLGVSFTTIDYNWIRDILSDDSDGVEVIEEKKPVLKPKSSTLITKNVHEDDDDDCIILDGDPEKDATVVEQPIDSDELLVIGEKGPGINFLVREVKMANDVRKFEMMEDFDSGPCILAVASELHAETFLILDIFVLTFHSLPPHMRGTVCHCYVCDSLAPCPKWGTGSLSSDHCHADDKANLWKIQRKTLKLGQSSPVPASTNCGTSPRPGNLQSNEFLHPGIIHLSANSVLPSQASRSNALHTVSSLTSTPQIQTSLSTIARPLSAPSLNLPNFSVQSQISRPINTTIMPTGTNITMPNGANLGGGFQESRPTLINRYQHHLVSRPALGVRSHPIQKERGNMASNLRPQLLLSHMSKGAGSVGNTLMANNSSHGLSGFSSHVNMTQHHNYDNATKFPNCIRPYHPTNIPFYSQPSATASLSCVNQDTAASETQANTQSLPQSNSSQDFHQACIQVNDVPSSYAGPLHGNEPHIRSQNGNASRNTSQFGTASQDTSQPQPRVESPMETAGKFSAFDSSWNDSTGQSILQSSGPANGVLPTRSNAPLIEIPGIPDSFADFDSWLLDKSIFQGVTDELLSSDLIIPSPNLDSDDMGDVLDYLNGE